MRSLQDLDWIEHGFGTRCSSEWPEAAGLASVRQIHSDNVLVANSAGCLGEGDALVTNRPGITLAVRTADCLPILIADPGNRAVAAVHAGWRGILQDIATKTIQSMHDQFGSRPEDLIVAIGPGIGVCCFEVGPEVFAQFHPEQGAVTGKAKVDLAETVSRQLRRNGITTGHLAAAGLCTRCRPDLFDSYRRDREAAGRMVSAIRIR